MELCQGKSPQVEVLELFQQRAVEKSVEKQVNLVVGSLQWDQVLQVVKLLLEELHEMDWALRKVESVVLAMWLQQVGGLAEVEVNSLQVEGVLPLQEGA